MIRKKPIFEIVCDSEQKAVQLQEMINSFGMDAKTGTAKEELCGISERGRTDLRYAEYHGSADFHDEV